MTIVLTSFAAKFLFFTIAGCIILLTAIAIVLGVYVIKAVKETRNAVRSVRMVERFIKNLISKP